MTLSQYTKEFRYNLNLATPVMLAMLGHTFVGFIDNVMVGQLGSAELAAVSLGNSFIFVAMSFGIGFSTAITPLVAEADSAKDFERGKSSFKHGLFLCTTLSILLFLLLLLAKPLMHVMDQPAEVVALAIPYLDLVGFSLIPLLVFQAFKQLSDGLSLVKYSMYATILANVLNIFFNYVLIFGKLGFPEMGIVGAALGTLLSRIGMLVFIWWLLHTKSRTRAYMTNLQIFNLDRTMIKKVFGLGCPSAMQMFFEVLIFTAAIWLSGTLGKNPQAANQIALNLATMTFMVASGLGVTAMIRVGNQKGLKNYSELRRIAKSIFLLGIIFATIFALTFWALHEVLPTIYVDMNDPVNALDNSEVVSIAASLLLLAAIFQIFDSMQVLVLGALRGLQDVKIPTLITFIAYWAIGFPISYFLGKAEVLGSIGIWTGLVAGLTSAAILLYIRFEYLTNKLILNKPNT